MKSCKFVALAMLGIVFATPTPLVAKEEPLTKSSVPIKSNIGQNEFPKLAKVPFLEMALEVPKQVPGKLLKLELEREHGYLIYSAEVVTDQGNVIEVLLDPTNGKILSKKINESEEED